MVILDSAILFIFSFGRFGTVCNKICNEIREFSCFSPVSEPGKARRKPENALKQANANNLRRAPLVPLF